jgi:uncharacterized phage protein (TIGR02218 family)
MGSLTHYGECWKITRADATVFGFTAHDRTFSYGGVTYEAVDSLSASATELSSLLGSVGNLEMAGVIASSRITETDLLGGVYDGATVEYWLLPWDGGADPATLLAKGTAGNISHGDLGFTMELLTDGYKLQQTPLVKTYTPGCRWRFGDANCTVDIDALKVTGTVKTLVAANPLNMASHRIFRDAAGRSEADGYFDLGRLHWLAGDNAGQVSEVKSYDEPTGEIVLWQPMIHAIEVDDEYEMWPGCPKTVAACKGFANYINFGGFPDVPGRDLISQAPNAK